MGVSAPAARTGVVADIGGTNARFAWVDLDSGSLEPRNPRDFRCRDFPTVQAAIEAYLQGAGLGRPERCVLAVAGPVNGGTITLTNAEWTVSAAELRRDGFGAARLINDFEALALVAGRLTPEDAPAVGGPEQGLSHGTLAILGAGTGLGVSALGREGGREVPLATEGGHVAFAPADETEIEVLRILARRFGRVSLERLLSGPGLANLHQALAEIDGVSPDGSDPEAITAGALAGDPRKLRTVERFCCILGSAAGDFALAFGARGGVFIAGGIAPRILDLLQRSDFRSRFEAKGRFEAYLRAIPTRVIVRPHAALIGAAAALRVMAAEPG
jgi:glucokinase